MDLHADFETRSAADLLKVGLDNYADDPTTDIWCMSWGFTKDKIDLWVPGEPLPAEIEDHIGEGGTLVAHNAPFEWKIWNTVGRRRYDFPELSQDQLRCTMAMAYAMGLPGALEKASAAVGLDIQKDMAGARLMKQMAKPRKILDDGTIIWWDDADRKSRLYSYCITDTAVEMHLDERLIQLSKVEKKVWHLDRVINERGVPVDIPTIKAAQDIVAVEKVRLDQAMDKLTQGWVSSTSNVNQLDDWLNRRIKKPKGVAKDVLKDLLKRDDLPLECRQAIELRMEAAKTSTAKMDAMIEASSKDGRVRDTTQYHGAGTGRWAGRRIQVHNFPRPTFKTNQTEQILDIVGNLKYTAEEKIELISMLFGPPMEALASSLRGLIKAPEGKEFCVADFANIEGRKAAWLAGEEWKLQAFRQYDAKLGPDLYLVAAGRTFGLPPDECKSYRQIGKVEELALQYQGGVGAFLTMAITYNLKIGDHYDVIWESATAEVKEQVENAWKSRGKTSGVGQYTWKAAEAVKVAWRKAHPAIVQLWYDLENAAIAAVADPGTIYSAGPSGRQVKFRVNGSFLWCQLPSKRVLCYAYPSLRSTELPWSTPENPQFKDALWYKGVDSQTRKWADISTYGGKLLENITQASSRDILVESMFKVEKAGMPIVMHVHDEIVSEVDEGVDRLEEMCEIMRQVPKWATGLPIEVEGWQGKRYRK